MSALTSSAALAASALVSTTVFFANTVPTDIQQPGSQPQDNVSGIQRPQSCDNCHGGYDLAVEPMHGWRGSMMSQASRDPIFWATMAIAEQDFDGSGDLCLRCHTPRGWLHDRSTPTDGSGLHHTDDGGVSCDLCHRLTNPDGSEHPGVQFPPFLANDEGNPPEAYLGSGMYVIYNGLEKLGPYDNPVTPHEWDQSQFHRSVDYCGTCHDVSNPAVGDLAPNNGAQVPLAPGTFDGTPGAPVDGKAAFNNFPYQYGVVERTFSEYKSSAFDNTLVTDYTNLPLELQDGSIEEAYLAATAGTLDGNYADGTPRFFSCQTCHMQPVTGKGCSMPGAPVREDLPLHDQVGGSYWAPDTITYLDNLGRLQFGGGLTSDEVAALQTGKVRALANLGLSGSLTINTNEVRVVNLTGHKLISGYPEGRRMWLRTTWYGTGGTELRVDGEYGEITAMIAGIPTQVETILDLHDPNTKYYEAHYGMTQDWAATLLGLGYDPNMVLTYDRHTGAVDLTLGALAGSPAGTEHHTFHFVLNNTVVADTRIPPYGMQYDDARTRNCLPVPETQYGNPGPGGTYDYFDEVTLNPPSGAESATVELLYQSTSWEYIQFLYEANDGTNTFLATVGDDILEAWLATGMCEPVVMASASWAPGGPFTDYCFCDAGKGPCGNDDPNGGCRNSTNSGATLTPGGTTSVSADDLTFDGAHLVPGQSALLFMGHNAVNGGAGNPFGDGLRCAGGAVIRLGVQVPDSAGSAHWGPGLGVKGDWGVGDTRRFQIWYRDPGVSPCGNEFNTSHGVEAVFVL